MVLSPTPPVLCLSTLIPSMALKSTMSPEWAIRMVHSASSRLVMPLRKTAIKKDAVW